MNTTDNILDGETERVLGRAEVLALLGVSPATLHRLVTRGAFVAPKRIGPGVHKWLRSEVLAWVKAQPTTRETVKG
jgi:predicted DNA-binding transcriptional regulator AlpA